MGSLGVIEIEVFTQLVNGFWNIGIIFKIHLLVATAFTLRHKRSMNMLSQKRPLPSQLIQMPLSFRRPVKLSLVN